MAEYYLQTFYETVRELDEEVEALGHLAREMAFTPQARPIPSGMIPDGLAPGHIAFRGDFPTAPQKTQYPRAC